MPDYVKFGSSPFRFSAAIDGAKQAIVKWNTAGVGGTALEIIPSGPSGYSPAMILWKKGWRDIYFLIEREGWEDDHYFRYAEKRMRELGIRRP